LRLTLAILPLIAIMAALSACDYTGEAMTIEYSSPENRAIWEIYSLVWWLAVAVFVAVEAALFYSVIRFRRRPGQGLPKQVHGNNRLEIAWTIVPSLLLILIAVPTVRGILNEAKAPPPDALRIHVTGHQFWWEAQYPELGIITANEIHVPVGRTVEFQLTSGDVQHSFWVARLGGKIDVFPNRINYLKFTPSETGTFFGQCAELCGTAHGFMKFYVFVQEPADYNAWVAQQQQQATQAANAPDLVKKGQQLVTGGACATCHTIAGTTMQGKVGPNLTHFGSRTTFASGWAQNNEENLKRWVHNPADIKAGVTTNANKEIGEGDDAHLISRMPAFPDYTDEELTAIAQYLLSLK